jgi:hypothetical protein
MIIDFINWFKEIIDMYKDLIVITLIITIGVMLSAFIGYIL